jgi:hypothetical protein
LDDGLVKPKHVAAFIVNRNVNFNILNQFNCALVGQIKDLIRVFLFIYLFIALDFKRINDRL